MLALLQRFAAGRGLFRGSKGWTRVWIVLVVFRFLQRMNRKPQVAFSYEIHPGDTLLIAGEGAEPRVLGGTLPD